MENKGQRLAKNTLFLTMRMLILMAVNLYTSRVLLKALGVEDYGIYNAVGGIVTMFSIISGSITAAITRYITFELGKGNQERLSRIFSTAVLIQCILAIIVLVFAETVGLWFLNSQMNIPENRMIAANWVFQFSIITFFINLISVPYNAAIIAHEKMKAFAYISIYEGIAKLAIAFLIAISPIDALIFYALTLCILYISIRGIYTVYCKRKFSECTIRLVIDKPLMKEMFGFAGWNFIGAASGILRDQGGNIIINIFCGPAVNAARGIAYQVNNAVNSFLTSFTTALHPQITKSYAAEDKAYFNSLLYKGAKFSYYILFIISLPLMLNVNQVVMLWLGQNPEYTTNFIILVLVLTMSESISMPLITAMLATGKIKTYQIIVGGLNMLNLPISYVLLKTGFSPNSVFITAIAISQACLIARLLLLKNMIGINIREFLKNVYIRITVVTVLSLLISLVVRKYIEATLTGLVLTSTVSVLCTVMSILLFGLTKGEKAIIGKYIVKLKKIILK